MEEGGIEEGDMEGRIIARVPRAAWRTMPWKNGGGVTHEIWREGEGPEGWGLRLSLAEVRAPGPFSRFPGVDRVILVVEGAGFVLQRADGLEVELRGPEGRQPAGRPFAFHGEDGWSCRLSGGPVLDFNVMRARSAPPAAVAVRGPGWVVARLWLCLEAGGADAVAGEPVERLELLALSGPVRSRVPGIGVG